MGKKWRDTGLKISNETDRGNDDTWKMVKMSKGQVVESIGGKDREVRYATQKEEAFTQIKEGTEIKKLMQKGGNVVDRPIMRYGLSYLGSKEEKMYHIKV